MLQGSKGSGGESGSEYTLLFADSQPLGMTSTKGLTLKKYFQNLVLNLLKISVY